ncbi:YiiX/YebB-like N1pC/P60 family cysteine hydrolase [Thalassospira sp. ER-Se-21-Dark]|uniref:YiiX/YebB-like N1pC/P60 family cysteine hydrolase n=1 Tax=Thalassospira sp. ER-Se-21-Dark TaxID=2585190 RepID=UPI001B3119BA|nr:YiiX/YebB-like N1pC/P60 family cysteine hydrolase [Thalassospira sp. ER-Se-21-Dark]MBP3124876.1 hypothetical protein [Thalassospira sp. ER-Se-21-Dark]
MNLLYTFFSCLIFAFANPAIASAQDLPSMVDKYFFDTDPPHGALIFQQRQSFEAVALRKVTGSFFTHVGIIRVTGGGPYVMQSSSETDGVEEVPMDEFINAGTNQDFAIYVDAKDIRGYGHLNHPASEAAYDFYHLPYDRYLMPGTDAFYSAELIFELFKKVGHPIGEKTSLALLNRNQAASLSTLFPDWQNHPVCKGNLLDEQMCLQRIGLQKIVIPDSLANDPKLRPFMTTYAN